MEIPVFPDEVLAGGQITSPPDDVKTDRELDGEEIIARGRGRGGAKRAAAKRAGKAAAKRAGKAAAKPRGSPCTVYSA